LSDFCVIQVGSVLVLLVTGEDLGCC